MKLDFNAIESIATRAALVRAGSQNDAQEVASPCVSFCVMDDASGLCQGCLRTLDEVCRWGNADDGFKRATWLQIESRLKEYGT